MEEQLVIQEDIGQIEKKIISVRGRQVILDRDLAALYGVETNYPFLHAAPGRSRERVDN